MAVWKWGNDPLPEQVELAGLIREMTTLMLVQEGAEPALREAVRAVALARDALAASAPASLRPRIGKNVDGDGRVYLDHCAGIPEFNPMFPSYDIDVAGPERATGTVTFPLCYEGSAGCVNGGVLGVFVDAVVQHHNCHVGFSRATRDLNLRYRRFTPVGVGLTFEIDRRAEDRLVHSEVRLLHDGAVVCEAVSDAVNVPGETPAISARRVG
jgi:stage V sporulation protein SpoVS